VVAFGAKRRERKHPERNASLSLRHACGYKLANDGHDRRSIQEYLGHPNIQNTTRHTALAPQWFKEFYRH
jgi:site-specific recombinase XerD